MERWNGKWNGKWNGTVTGMARVRYVGLVFSQYSIAHMLLCPKPGSHTKTKCLVSTFCHSP